MIRRFLTAASVVSLLLCMTLAGLWVRSCAISDSYFTENGTRDFTFTSTSGVLRLVEHRGLPKSMNDRPGLTHGKPYGTSNDPDPGEPGVRSHLQAPGLSWLISGGGRTMAPVGIPASLLPPAGVRSSFTFFPSASKSTSPIGCS